LIQGKFLKRIPDWVNIAVVIIIAILYGFLSPRFYKIKNILLFSIGLLFIYTTINLYLFKIGYWLFLLPPVLTIFACSLAVFAIQFFRTHKLFRQFVVPEVADKMVQSDSYAELGGTEKMVSILFSDIRGYTSLSEKMTPTEVVDMLNEYHTEMVKIYEKHFGRVVDYMGDAQMVMFGAPIERKDHALCACNAAIEVQESLSSLNEKWADENRLSFEVGIGICTGYASIGFVGAEGHKQFTAIGDTVNVASRLQGQSKVLGASIILSPLTVEQIRDKFNVRHLGEVPLKGKSEPMQVYTMESRKD
jgi:adenylate cyclase